MAAAELTERYSANLHGVLSCYDRMIFTGTYLWNSRQEADAMYTDSWRAFVQEKYGTDAIVTYFESPVTVDNLTGQVIGD